MLGTLPATDYDWFYLAGHAALHLLFVDDTVNSWRMTNLVNLEHINLQEDVMRAAQTMTVGLYIYLLRLMLCLLVLNINLLLFPWSAASR